MNKASSSTSTLLLPSVLPVLVVHLTLILVLWIGFLLILFSNLLELAAERPD